MKAADIRQLTPEELEARIKELRSSLFGLKIKYATCAALQSFAPPGLFHFGFLYPTGLRPWLHAVAPAGAES